MQIKIDFLSSKKTYIIYSEGLFIIIIISVFWIYEPIRLKPLLLGLYRSKLIF